MGGTRLDGVLFPGSEDLISGIEDKGFPGSSAGKESSCSAGDPSSIPGSARSAGEGIGSQLQYSGLENSMDYSMGSQESDMTERLSLSF